MLLIICAVTVRVLFVVFNPPTNMLSDSYGYYDIGNNILNHPTLSTVINQYRLPGYPIFLSSIVTLTQGDQSPINNLEARWITVPQNILGIVSCVFLFCMLLTLSIPKSLAFGVSLFQAMNITIFSWEWVVMPEAIAQVILIGMIYILIQLIYSPSKTKYVAFGILGLLGWLVRPNLIIVPIISLIILFPTIRNKRLLWIHFTILILSIIFPLLYVWGNISFHGYSGISQVNEIDLLGRILEFNLPLEAGKQQKDLYKSITAYQKTTKMPSPYEYMTKIDPSVDVNLLTTQDLPKFDRTIISHNVVQYVFQAVKSIPTIFSDSDIYINGTPQNLLYDLFYSLQIIYNTVWYGGYLLFILWPVSVWIYFTKPKRIHIVPVLLGAISICQILIIVLFDFYTKGLYGRLASIIQPETFLFLVIFVYNIFHKDKVKT